MSIKIRKPITNWTDNSGYSSIELYPDQSYKSFVPNAETEWMVLDNYVLLKADVVVHLFQGGTLRLGVLGSDLMLKVFGVSALAAANTKIEFHSSGQIRAITLAAQEHWLPWQKKWSYKGKSYSPGTRLEFSEDGAVEKWGSL